MTKELAMEISQTADEFEYYYEGRERTPAEARLLKGLYVLLVFEIVGVAAFAHYVLRLY